MKKMLMAAVLVVLAVCAGTSVSWGQTVTPDSATWEATWEGTPLDGIVIWQ